jgi:hypothetical protein
MTKGLLFWVLWILAVLFGCFGGYHAFHAGGDWYMGFGMPLLELILFGLLGWQVFGGAVK